MPFRYEINGNIVEFDSEPTEQDIDEAAKQFPKVEVSAEEPVADSGETKKYLAETLGIPQWAEDAVVGPIAETVRGFAIGTSSFYNKLDAASKFIENTTGLKRGGIFQDWSEQAKQVAEAIPETQQNPFNKIVFGAAGSTPAVLSEFATVPGGNITKFATLQAIEEYGKLEDPNFVEGSAALLKGSRDGATVGMAFGAAPVLLTKARDVLAKIGKSAAKKFITFITGNKELAKDFVKNPDKYSVFKKPINTSENIKKEIKETEQLFKKKHRVEKESFKFKQDRDKLLISEQLKDAKNNLSQARIETINDMSSKRKASLESIMRTNEKAIQESNMALNQNATNFMDNTLAKYNLLKKQKGEAVGAAIDLLKEQNPNATIPFKNVNTSVRSVIKKSPFEFVGKRGNELLKPTTAISAEAKDLKEINSLIIELRSMRKEGFKPYYLQKLKEAAHEKAAIAHNAGKDKLRIFWQDIAKAVNPAEIVSKDQVLSKRFSNLAEANKDFSIFTKSYDRAMGKYFKKNELEEFVPDVNKALTAVAKGDTVTIREMKLADMALPQEDRILPKFQKLLQQADDLATKQKANVKLVKNRFDMEQREFKKASKEAINNLAKEQRFATQTEKQRGVVKLREFIESQEDEYNLVKNKLDESLSFFEAQESLRQFGASSGGAGILQHILGFSGIAPIFSGQIRAGAAAGFFALSPQVASPTIKGALRAGQVIGRGVQAATPILSRPEVGQVVGTRILKENE
jgi:hypothetical protein